MADCYRAATNGLLCGTIAEPMVAARVMCGAMLAAVSMAGHVAMPCLILEWPEQQIAGV